MTSALCRYKESSSGCPVNRERLVNGLYDSLNGSFECLSDDEFADNIDFPISFVAQTHALSESLECERPRLRRSLSSLGPQCHFLCPLSKRMMKDPVVTPHMFNFERKEILKRLEIDGDICPLSGKPLRASDLKANNKLQWEILYWQRKHAGDGKLSVDDLALPPLNRVDAALNVSEQSGRRKVDAPPLIPRKEKMKIEQEIDTAETAQDEHEQIFSRRRRLVHAMKQHTKKEDSPPFVPRRSFEKKAGNGFTSNSPACSSENLMSLSVLQSLAAASEKESQNRSTVMNDDRNNYMGTSNPAIGTSKESVLDVIDELLDLGILL